MELTNEARLFPSSPAIMMYGDWGFCLLDTAEVIVNVWCGEEWQLVRAEVLVNKALNRKLWGMPSKLGKVVLDA